MKSLILAAFFLPLSIVGISAQSNLQRSVFFDKDKSELKPQGQVNLLEVMDFLNKNPTFQILLKGFTDADGSDEHNRALAERRVQTVRQFLEQKSVNTSKITTLAIGKAQPIANNATEEGKKQNRRVDINVTFVQNTPSVTSPSKGKTDNLLSLYRELATPIQSFKINTAKDTIIKGAKGTVLAISKNAFAGVPNGAVVDFKLKEAYSFSDIIRDNLNTMSGDKMLQTGGMIYTEANYKGEQLTLQQNLQVKFNSKESQLESMQLFSGERNMQKNGEMNWTPLSKEAQKEEITTIFSSTNDIFTPYLILNEKTNKPITLKELCDTIGCYPLLIKESQFGGFTVRPNMNNTCGAMAMFLNDRPNLSRNVSLEKVHKLTYAEAYYIYGVNTFSELKNQDGRKWDSLMNIRFRIIRANEKQIANKEQFLQFERIFPTNQLGWLNCDAYSMAERVELTISSDIKNSSDIYANYKIIVKKRKAILANYIITDDRAIVNMIPRNEDFFVVSIKVLDGQSYVAIEENKAIENLTIKLNYKQMSAAEIKEKLKVLDN